MDLEKFPDSPSAQEMMSYVSEGWYDKAYVGKWIYQVLGLSMDEVTAIYEELPYQFFPATATWGLAFHERKYGLSVNESMGLEERRSRIWQKQMTRLPMTPCHMEELLKSVTDFQVHISDIHDLSRFVGPPAHPNQFQIVLIGEGTADLKKIREILNQVKQSHTAYEIFYYEKDPVCAEISGDAALTVREEFYPRKNQEYLFLDGTWILDEEHLLSGYKKADKTDDYPLSQRILMEVSCPVAAGGAAVVRERRIDGSWKLDGSRKLDGGRYIL